jgi:hypothetical protein
MPGQKKCSVRFVACLFFVALAFLFSLAFSVFAIPVPCGIAGVVTGNGSVGAAVEMWALNSTDGSVLYSFNTTADSQGRFAGVLGADAGTSFTLFVKVASLLPSQVLTRNITPYYAGNDVLLTFELVSNVTPAPQPSGGGGGGGGGGSKDTEELIFVEGGTSSSTRIKTNQLVTIVYGGKEYVYKVVLLNDGFVILRSVLTGESSLIARLGSVSFDLDLDGLSDVGVSFGGVDFAGFGLLSFEFYSKAAGPLIPLPWPSEKARIPAPPVVLPSSPAVVPEVPVGVAPVAEVPLPAMPVSPLDLTDFIIAGVVFFLLVAGFIFGYRGILSKRRVGEKVVSKVVVSQERLDALDAFVSAGLAKGYSPGHLRSILLERGWPADVVDSALAKAFRK